MYTEEQMEAMKVQLGEMISFWKYDEGGATGPVNTKFFEGTPNPYGTTFESYNKTKTLPNCGKFKNNVTSYMFTETKYE